MLLDTPCDCYMANLRESRLECAHLRDRIGRGTGIHGGVQAVYRVLEAADAFDALLVAFQQVDHHYPAVCFGGLGACLQRAHRG